MGRYTTAEIVASRLRTKFSATSEPTASDVEDMIAEVEEAIDDAAGRTFNSSTTVSNEYHDYAGGTFLVVKNPGLLTVTSVEYSSDGGTTWSTISASNYLVDTDYDLIRFKTNTVTGQYPSIPEGDRTIRISYTYGYSSVPYRIRRLATDMAKLEVIASAVGSSAQEEGGTIKVGPIQVIDPTNFSVTVLQQERASVEERLSKLQGSRIRTTIGVNLRSW